MATTYSRFDGLKRADRSRARLALILGENEVNAGRVIVKPLREESEQVSLAQDDLTGFLEASLASDAQALTLQQD